jgi:predicted nucleic acid-binding protein
VNIVIDAGVILKGYFADETGHEYAQHIIKEYADGRIEFHAPHLIMYELINALNVAANRKRLVTEQINEIIDEIKEIEINLLPIGDIQRLFDISIKYGCSTYDAAYILIAESHNMKMITADARLYNAVKGKIPGVVWFEDYRKLKH